MEETKQTKVAQNGRIATWFMLVQTILTSLITASLIAAIGFLWSLNARVAVVETEIRIGNRERTEWRKDWTNRINSLEDRVNETRR